MRTRNRDEEKRRNLSSPKIRECSQCGSLCESGKPCPHCGFLPTPKPKIVIPGPEVRAWNRSRDTAYAKAMQAMSAKKEKAEQYIKLYADMIRCPSMRNIPTHAWRVVLAVMDEHNKKGGKENGRNFEMM